MEHLRTRPGKALRPEEFQTIAKSVGDQPWAERVQEGTALQVPASKKAQVDSVGAEPGPKFMNFEQLQASLSSNWSPRGFGKSPLGRFKVTSKNRIIFSLEAALETSLYRSKRKEQARNPSKQV